MLCTCTVLCTFMQRAKRSTRQNQLDKQRDQKFHVRFLVFFALMLTTKRLMQYLSLDACFVLTCNSPVTNGMLDNIAPMLLSVINLTDLQMSKLQGILRKL